MTNAHSDYLNELSWRGLLHQTTNDDAIRAHLAEPGSSPRRAYTGFDPTADSLTIGNLVPIMMMVHLARAGHEPSVVSGGGTGLIGDPSGKSAERQLMTAERVADNVEQQAKIFGRVFEHAGLPAPTRVNNLDWLSRLSFLEVLRDVGKHFSVNMMVQKDSVRERLNSRDQGISYTEFSYMILQSYDFAHLHDRMGVTIQMGGSDQFGNIVAGTDLIRRRAAAAAIERNEDPEAAPAEAFGITAPLVTKADGGKFGKTESGAVWLSGPAEGEAADTPARTSAYEYYQFWLNASDEDVGRYLRLFTLLTREEIEALEAEHAEAPGKRAAQRKLAQEATALLHGPAARDQAEAAGKALFSGDIAGLDANTLASVFAGAPSSTLDRARLEGEGVAAVDLLIEIGLAKSKREAREFLGAGSVSANGEKANAERVFRAADLLHGTTIALRRGKKAWHVTRWM